MNYFRSSMLVLAALAAFALTVTPGSAHAGVTVYEEGEKKLALSGDMRFRYEQDTNSREGKDDRERNRQRLRLRLGGKYTANDNVEMGFRLATSADDDHSTHHTFGVIGGGSGEAGFGIDRGYIKISSGPVWGWIGKNANVIWDPMGFTWDNDLQPEGFGLGGKLIGSVTFFASAGYYLLNESSWGANDDTMLAYQAGVKVGKSLGVTAAAGGYTVTDNDEDNPESELAVPGGSATYLNGMVELSAKEIAGSPSVGFLFAQSDVDKEKYIGVGAEDSDLQAWVVYTKAKLGPVNLKVSYQDIGYAGATGLGYFTQDDFPYTSNYTGFSVSVGAKIFGAISANLKYYSQEVKNGDIDPSFTDDVQTGPGNKRDRIQINLNLKF